MNTFHLSMLLLAFCATTVYSQGFLIIENDNSNALEEKEPNKEDAVTSPRPYSPLKPMHLPPHFQSLGYTLPPPQPPPLHFEQLNHFLLQLGHADKRFLSFLKPFLFPWLTTSTTTTTTAKPTT